MKKIDMATWVRFFFFFFFKMNEKKYYNFLLSYFSYALIKYGSY